MAAKECPRCKLVSSASALLCDCGYSFASSASVADVELKIAALKKTRRLFVFGGGIAGLMELIKTPETAAHRSLPSWFGWFTAASALSYVVYASIKIGQLQRPPEK